MHYGGVDRNNQLVHHVPLELPGARCPHDMGITKHYTILHDLPLYFDRSHTLKAKASYGGPESCVHVREGVGEALTGEKAGRVSSCVIKLQRNLPAFRSLARFAPFVGGDRFSMADCAAYAHLPAIGMATRKVFGTDLLLEAGIDWKAYVKALAERPSVRRVNDDTRAYLAALGR